MEPLPETAEALRLLDVGGEGEGLLAALQRTAGRVAAAIPECLGVSIAFFDSGLTFTLLATESRLRALDAVQYLDGGPCQTSAETGEEVAVPDLLDEGRWQLMAIASGALGVHSSLSLPLRRGGEVVGSINFYGAGTDSFDERARQLATLFGAAAEDAVANADLSMASVERAREAPQQVATNVAFDQAVGVLMQRRGIERDEAVRLMHDAADRAGVPPPALARLILQGADVV